MLDSSAQDQFVELTRGWLAAGTGRDEALGRLRQRGLNKIDCIGVLRAAAGVSAAEAKVVVHHSRAWADHREGDEHLEDMFWRAAFIECVLSGGSVNEPAEWAAECSERQQRAAAQLQGAAAGLRDEALIDYREAMARNRLGAAFVALVAAVQQRDMPASYWFALAAAAEALCLNELLDGDQSGTDVAEIQAALAVRRRTNPTD